MTLALILVKSFVGFLLEIPHKISGRQSDSKEDYKSHPNIHKQQVGGNRNDIRIKLDLIDSQLESLIRGFEGKQVINFRERLVRNQIQFNSSRIER